MCLWWPSVVRILTSSSTRAAGRPGEAMGTQQGLSTATLGCAGGQSCPHPLRSAASKVLPRPWHRRQSPQQCPGQLTGLALWMAGPKRGRALPSAGTRAAPPTLVPSSALGWGSGRRRRWNHFLTPAANLAGDQLVSPVAPCAQPGAVELTVLAILDQLHEGHALQDTCQALESTGQSTRLVCPPHMGQSTRVASRCCCWEGAGTAAGKTTAGERPQPPPRGWQSWGQPSGAAARPLGSRSLQQPAAGPSMDSPACVSTS